MTGDTDGQSWDVTGDTDGESWDVTGDTDGENWDVTGDTNGKAGTWLMTLTMRTGTDVTGDIDGEDYCDICRSAVRQLRLRGAGRSSGVRHGRLPGVHRHCAPLERHHLPHHGPLLRRRHDPFGVSILLFFFSFF